MQLAMMPSTTAKQEKTRQDGAAAGWMVCRKGYAVCSNIPITWTQHASVVWRPRAKKELFGVEPAEGVRGAR